MMVTVLPVPGGPTTMKGFGPAERLRMQLTASVCCLFWRMAWVDKGIEPGVRHGRVGLGGWEEQLLALLLNLLDVQQLRSPIYIVGV